MKKLGLIFVLGLTGCQLNGVTNEPKSLTEKMSMLDKVVREQTGKIEVLEHENQVLKTNVETIKLDTNARLNVLERKAFLSETPTESPQ
ncbi:MAG: hypothetical protein JXR30_03240 [Alphaproteobacteria bacterium]|nr:hypothetical protein [Alphaproteobacteria bacterium]